ncbi:tumor necrosis factor receptor superfamily member 10B-like isoform X1 [Ambystoma mexicanum]|uniref:tumor necrosis factor receptor superfamily member 10B-like isoform X1 n=1 Tax=Ambystoma mexicanum TaxID=8296 RepID=UPI0037E839A2
MFYFSLCHMLPEFLTSVYNSNVFSTAPTSRSYVIPREEAWSPALQRGNSVHQDYLNDREQTDRCLECPAGTHQAEDCARAGSRRSCLPCIDGRTYIEYPNDLNYCLPCWRCRADEEEESRCSTTRNTKCRCKMGTFCLPDNPCEVCIRCKTSCPEGEQLIASCNATSDSECVKSTDPPPNQDSTAVIVSSVLLAVLVLLIGIACYIWKKMRSESNDGQPGSACEVGGSLAMKFFRRCCKSSDQEARDNHLNNARDPAKEPILPNQGLLTPVDGDEIKTLQRSFEFFADVVTVKEWPKFMRRLGLEDNDIQVARADNSGVREQNYQMLSKWHDRMGCSVSVNTVLQALRAIKLEAKADRIQWHLVENQLYKLESVS